MVNECIHSRQIPEYLDGELSGSEQREFEKHLKVCRFCRSELSEFGKLNRHLIQRRRAEPPKLFLRKYHQELASIFGKKKRPISLNRIWSFINIPSPVMRVVRVTVVLVIGVSIGWFFARRNSPSIRPEASGLQMQHGAVRQIGNYFHESEMWLLDVMNLSKNGDVDSDDWDQTRDEAERLLRKTMMIRELAYNGDPKLSGYFDDLEMLFMELINSPEVDRSEMLKQIKQTISELNLQLRISVLQEKMSVS